MMNVIQKNLAVLTAVAFGLAAAQAEERSTLSTALSSTTISGYVDTSMQWNFGSNGTLPPYSFGGSDKADGFNLNVVQLTIAKALEEGEWASGYRVDLWFGPDANTLGTASVLGNGHGGSSADLGIRQAYVNLRTPVGNGIE